MESAGRLIAKLNRERPVMTAEDIARAAWPRAVGKRIAACTAVDRLVRKCLVVQVQDMVWQRQLNTLRRQILKNLTDVIGAGLVEGLEFRPMTPKRMPQRAEVARADSATFDEADSISDPQLRRVYKLSRKKAIA